MPSNTGVCAVDLPMNETGSIKLYILSICLHCKALRDYLEERKLTFEYVDVDLLQGNQRREMLKEVRRFNGRCSFPTSVIGHRVVVGLKEDELKEVLASYSAGLKEDILSSPRGSGNFTAP
jgi:glutaredoxin